MIKTFVSGLIFLMVRSGELGFVAADSCALTAPNQTLSTTLTTGAVGFSINLYNELKNATNLFYSPFSVRVALAMTAVGAGGNTLAQMNQTLQLDGFDNQTESDEAFQQYLSSFCSNSNYTLSTANRIYVQNDFTVYLTFTKTLSTYFMSSAENVDFGANPGGVANTINSWVEQQTNDTIKNLFASNSFSAATVLVLVNAIYFKGTWQVKFDTSKTKNGAFTLASGRTVEVPIMHLTDSFNYYDSPALQSQVLQMNYAGNHLAMHIVLPAEGVSLSTVQQNINSQNINDVINNYSTQKVIVSLPKFKANFKQELNAPLKSLGMVDVFDPAAANLSGIASIPSNANLYVSSVIHQAYVAVDEEGTTAAAATGVSISLMSASVDGNQPQPIVFNVNRPCIYLICDLHTDQFLFMGNLDNPSISS